MPNIYSRLYGIINEDSVTINSGSSSSSSSSSSNIVTGGGNKIDNSSNKKSSTETYKKGTDVAAKIKTGSNTTGASNAATNNFKDDENMKKATSEQLDNFQTQAVALIKAYSTARTTVFASMLNGLQNMRNDYTAVVRAHVKSYVGAIDTEDSDTSRKKSTDKDTN